MTSQDSEGLWAKLSKRPAILVAGGLGLLVLGYAAGQGAKDGQAPRNEAAPVTAKGDAPAAQAAANTGGGPVPLTEISSGPCRSYAPEGWEVTDKNNEGTIFTIQSHDRALTAAYAGMPINGGMVSGAYGDQFRTPQGVALYVVGQLAGEQVRADSEETVGSYQALKFSGATHGGYVLYYKFPLSADPAGFGMILRIAIGKAGDTQSIGAAGSAMAAIQCQSSLRPPPQGMYQVEARLSDHGAGQSASGSDVTLAGTYNAQLNTGWAHDSAGRNYRVNVTEDWKSGSDGEGFYSPSGEKLQAGLQ